MSNSGAPVATLKVWSLHARDASQAREASSRFLVAPTRAMTPLTYEASNSPAPSRHSTSRLCAKPFAADPQQNSRSNIAVGPHRYRNHRRPAGTGNDGAGDFTEGFPGTRIRKLLTMARIRRFARLVLHPLAGRFGGVTDVRLKADATAFKFAATSPACRRG